MYPPKNIGRVVVMAMTIMFVAIKALAADTDGVELLRLAKEKFKQDLKQDLWPAEEELFLNRGTVDCTPPQAHENDNDTNTDHVCSWSTDREIRVDRLTWLCTDAKALKLVSDNGIQITAARICSNPGEPNEVNLEKARFPVRLKVCDIQAGLRVNNAHLPDLNLNGTHITGNLDAYQVTVDHDVALGNGFKADGRVTFYVANIGGDFDCGGGHFNNPDTESFAIEFRGTKVAGNVYLSDFEADGRVYFSGSTVNNDFTWAVVTNADKAILDLSSLKVGRFHDDEKSWPRAGNLRLDGFIYEEIMDEHRSIDVPKRIAWLDLQPGFHPQPYQQLATMLRARGFEDEAVTVLISKNLAQARFTHRFSWSWWWYNVFGWFINYGYRPTAAFRTSIGFILFGWILFSFGYGNSNYCPKDSLFRPTGREKSDVKFNALVYSLESFVPLVKLGIDDCWQPDANKGRPWPSKDRVLVTTGGLLRCYLWFHIIVGWILTTLLVGVLTGLLKT